MLVGLMDGFRQGVPFIEDLLQRHPSPWLKVGLIGFLTVFMLHSRS